MPLLRSPLPNRTNRARGFIPAGRCRILRWLGLALVPLPLAAAVYHVAPPPAGNDAAAGTAGAPWATIGKAAETLRAGDTVLIRGGTYPITTEIRPRRSGTPGQWIQYVGYPGEQVVIDADGHAVDAATADRDGGSFQIEKVAYLRVINLEMRNSHNAGFLIQGYARPDQPVGTLSETHHIDLIGCRTRDTLSSGIGAWFSDHLRILGCEVVGASNPEMRQPQNGSTGPHEAITISRCRNFEAGYNTLHHCYKEGIDAKGTCQNGWIHHNLAYECARQGLYTDARRGTYTPIPGLDRTEYITFSHNVVHHCEWGIGLAAEQTVGYLYRVVVLGNLLLQNRGSGIFFATWSQQGPLDDILIAHNTTWRNGSEGHWVGVTGGIDLRTSNVRRVRVYNNLCLEDYSFGLGTFVNPATQANLFVEKEIQASHNLQHPWQERHFTGSSYGALHSWTGEAALLEDPQLLDPEGGLFYLGHASPARAAATPLDEPLTSFPARADLGAFPAGAQNLPAELLLEPLQDAGLWIWTLPPHGVAGGTVQSANLTDWDRHPAHSAGLAPALGLWIPWPANHAPVFFRWSAVP